MTGALPVRIMWSKPFARCDSRVGQVLMRVLRAEGRLAWMITLTDFWLKPLKPPLRWRFSR